MIIASYFIINSMLGDVTSGLTDYGAMGVFYATIVGLILGVGLIGGSMFLAAFSYDLSMSNFWNLESMMIVLGGTLSATAIAFRLNDVKNVFGLIKFVFKKPTFIRIEKV